MHLLWTGARPTTSPPTRIGKLLRGALIGCVLGGFLTLPPMPAATAHLICGQGNHPRDTVATSGSEEAHPQQNGSSSSSAPEVWGGLEQRLFADARSALGKTPNRPIASRSEVASLTDAHLYAGYSREDLALIVGSNPSDTGYLHPLAAYAFHEMKAAGEAEGFKFTIGSAWRPWKRQLRAYEHFQVTGQNLNGDPVPNIAHPCDSKHPAALAVDMVVPARSAFHRWLLANAASFGFKNTRADEPWEWQFIGVEDPPPQRLVPPSQLVPT